MQDSATGNGRPAVTFGQAAEATRRAAFLNLAHQATPDAQFRQQLGEVFRVCRSAAVTAGAAQGLSAAEVDAAITALCNGDTVLINEGSDEEFGSFAQESGEVVQRFLAVL